MLQNKKILLTGATGMLGGELVVQLANGGAEVYCVVRANSDEQAQERLNTRLKKSTKYLEGKNISAVAGDVTEEGLGLKNPIECDIIVHAAAETSFNKPESCTLLNIGGTEKVIMYARQLQRQPLFCYISTACNVGDIKDECLDEDGGCRPENNHHNPYTKSKAIAEGLVRSSGLEFLIIRPPILLSDTIKDKTFARQIFWSAPLMMKFDALPVRHNSNIDIVPVSFVVNYTAKLLDLPTRKYDTYNVSTGIKDCYIVHQWMNAISKFYNVAGPELINPADWTEQHYEQYVVEPGLKKYFRSLEYYLPFMNMNVVFNNRRLKEEFGQVIMSPLKSYIDFVLSQITEEEAVKESEDP